MNSLDPIMEEMKISEALEESKRVASKFILDPDKVYKISTFTWCKLNNEKMAIGVLLPKEDDIKDSKGRYIGKKQILAPALITSSFEIIEVINDFIPQYRVRFEAIPGQLEIRWGLNNIKEYLEGKAPQIQKDDVINQIKSLYEKFLFFHHKEWYLIHSLWDIGTYFFQLFDAYPIMELRGLKGAAKTKIMKVSSRVTFNGSPIMTNPSESTLFRETHEKRQTKYIDEAEKLFTFIKGQMISSPQVEVINASYSKGGYVPRVEKINGKFVTIYFGTYSPTMVGSINGLYGATEDRALIHITVKAPSNDLRGNLEPSEDSEDWQSIRNYLYLFCLQNWADIERGYKDLKNTTKKLRNRDFQIWKPILALARFFSEEMYNEVLRFAEKSTEDKGFSNITEGSLDAWLIEKVGSLLDKSNPNNEIEILSKSIRVGLPDGMNASPKTISKKMDSFGFDGCKVHTRDGNGWKISYSLFESRILPIYPSLASQVSQDEGNRLIIVNDGEELVNNVNVGREGCEAYEGFEGCLEVPPPTKTYGPAPTPLNYNSTLKSEDVMIVLTTMASKKSPVCIEDFLSKFVPEHRSELESVIAMWRKNGDILEPRLGYIMPMV